MKPIAQKKIQTRRGSALALVLVMVVIVSIILTSLLTFISSQITFSKDRVERERAFQIAEAGVYYYRWYLAHKIEGKTVQQISDFWQNGNPYGVSTPYEAEYKDPEGVAIGKYKLEVQKPALGSTIVTVKSTGWTYLKPSVKRIVQVRFRRPSWSENAALANDVMRFGQGTTVTGKIQSNQGVRFDGVATNVVSSSLASYDDPDHDEYGTDKLEFGVHTHVNAPPGSGVNENYRPNEVPPHSVDSRSDVFQGGRLFPAPQFDFTSLVSDISFMRTNASIKYDNTGQGRYIKFYADGTMDVCKVNTITSSTNDIYDYNGVVTGASSGNGSACITAACCSASTCDWIQSDKHNKGKCVSLTNVSIPDDGIIFVANNVWLEGTINDRKVTVVAAELTDESNYTGGHKNVFLGKNNLLYTNTDGRDIVGIIAQNNVEIIKNSQDNLTIDAALLAKEGRVGRNSYGDKKSSITINGSIATNIRYGFAYVGNYYNCGNGVYIDNGYCTRNLNFDNNLLYYPPPYFPTGTEYSIDLWDEL